MAFLIYCFTDRARSIRVRVVTAYAQTKKVISWPVPLTTAQAT